MICQYPLSTPMVLKLKKISRKVKKTAKKTKKTASSFPDVTTTKTPAGKVPIPYPNTKQTKKKKNAVKKVSKSAKSAAKKKSDAAKKGWATRKNAKKKSKGNRSLGIKASPSQTKVLKHA